MAGTRRTLKRAAPADSDEPPQIKTSRRPARQPRRSERPATPTLAPADPTPTPAPQTPAPEPPPAPASPASNDSQRRAGGTTCELCHQRKVKCDRADPCGGCTALRADCVPHVRKARVWRRRRFPEADLLRKLREHEALLRERGIAFKPLYPPGLDGDGGGDDDAHEGERKPDVDVGEVGEDADGEDAGEGGGYDWPDEHMATAGASPPPTMSGALNVGYVLDLERNRKMAYAAQGFQFRQSTSTATFTWLAC
jgi:hypothetical protein